jgi:hypothetical protein
MSQATIVSFCPFEINRGYPGMLPASYKIPASDLKTPTVVYISDAKDYYYADEARGYITIPRVGPAVAAAIVDDYINDQPLKDVNAVPAVWKYDEYKTLEEILKDKELITNRLEKQRAWFQAICKMADNDWSKYHHHSVISTFHLTAARALNLNSSNHEWMDIESNISVKCVACQSSISSKAIICPHCRFIVNEVEYKKLNFHKGA